MNGLDAPMRLSVEQLDLCHRTISPHTFYMIVGDALVSGKELSVVRMGDGEVRLYKACAGATGIVTGFDPEWLSKLGVTGIGNFELATRLYRAATECTYFAPSITGIQHADYDLYRMFPSRDRYVDNFYVNAWDEPSIIKLYKQAGHVLLIHGNPATADSLQIRAQANIGVKVSYLRMTNWRDAYRVIDEASRIDAKLVLFSAGPAGKFIGPMIAVQGKVVLDIGNSVDAWTLASLPADLIAAENFYYEYVARA